MDLGFALRLLQGVRVGIPLEYGACSLLIALGAPETHYHRRCNQDFPGGHPSQYYSGSSTLNWWEILALQSFLLFIVTVRVLSC